MRTKYCNERYEFEAENPCEERELEELMVACINRSPFELEKMLGRGGDLWRSLILAYQIVDDLEDIMLTYNPYKAVTGAIEK